MEKHNSSSDTASTNSSNSSSLPLGRKRKRETTTNKRNREIDKLKAENARLKTEREDFVRRLDELNSELHSTQFNKVADIDVALENAVLKEELRRHESIVKSVNTMCTSIPDYDAARVRLYEYVAAYSTANLYAVSSAYDPKEWTVVENAHTIALNSQARLKAWFKIGESRNKKFLYLRISQTMPNVSKALFIDTLWKAWTLPQAFEQQALSSANVYSNGELNTSDSTAMTHAVHTILVQHKPTHKKWMFCSTNKTTFVDPSKLDEKADSPLLTSIIARATATDSAIGKCYTEGSFVVDLADASGCKAVSYMVIPEDFSFQLSGYNDVVDFTTNEFTPEFKAGVEVFNVYVKGLSK